MSKKSMTFTKAKKVWEDIGRDKLPKNKSILTDLYFKIREALAMCEILSNETTIEVDIRTCEFCKYKDVDLRKSPCRKCCNYYINRFEKKRGRKNVVRT